MWNEHLGYVLTCPSNLGTGLRRCPRQASLLGQGREEVGQSPRPPPSPEARNRWCRHRLLRRHLRCLQRRPYRLLRGRAPPVRLRRCRSPHRDGEAGRRGQALRRSHPRHHEEVNASSASSFSPFPPFVRSFFFFFFFFFFFSFS